MADDVGRTRRSSGERALLGVAGFLATALGTLSATAGPADARGEVDLDDPFLPSFEPLRVPPTRDDRASAVFMNRALSFYASQEKYRRAQEGGVGVVSGTLVGAAGALLLARDETRSDRYAGGAVAIMGLAFLGAGIERLVLRSALEGLREDYVSWRNDDRVPTWVAVNRARRGWRAIALRERTFRRWSGWLSILAGAASAGFGVASAFDESSGRAYASTLGFTSLVLAASGVRLLTTETPAEAGYRAWLVYVQPLPPADAPQSRNSAAPSVGGREWSGVVGVRGTW